MAANVRDCRVMKAMILAAGRGERMRPLTDHCPKPLLAVGGKPLIVWHLERLAGAGFADIVINHAHLGTMIEQQLGDGSRWGVRIAYSPEPPGALETAGGIAKALHLLGASDEAFLVVNGDIWCDWDFAAAAKVAHDMTRRHDLAHLLMAANPPQHPQGDFALVAGRLVEAEAPRQTFTGIGVYSPRLFAGLVPGVSAKLAPLLHAAISENRVGGELHGGRWFDIGTPQRLQKLDAALSQQTR
jgi:MurNAc alpha-1-phosphate uridylyltransferase